MQKKISLLLTLLALPLSSQAGESHLYDFLWLDPDKKVYVLQNKIYQKKNSLYLDIGFTTNTTSEFEDINGASLKLGYYFHEEWAFELLRNTYSSSTNSAFESVKAVNGTEPFIRRPTQITALLLVWSPFYGKINTFNKIYYFDWSFGLGYGEMNAQSNLSSVRNPGSPNIFEDENYNPIILKTNIKFHLNKNFHIGLEFLNSNIQAGSPKFPDKKEWKQNKTLLFN